MSTPDVPFSARLRAASQQAHSDAESQRYVAALVAGDLDLAAYTDLVVQHHTIYAALESVGDRLRDDPLAGGFVDEALLRLPALEADLAHLLGEDWPDRAVPTLAAAGYAARIRAVCADSPERFIAHHYTRYLGDLSGGLHIGRSVARRYGLSDDFGVAFYRFDGIPRPKVYKDAYRARLDALPLSEPAEAALLEEVLVAYRHNTAVFADLARHVPTETAAGSGGAAGVAGSAAGGGAGVAA
ncbi:biliverdin-producing heme oxygenase [Micromonospora yangpuensis]|uniref:Heme oxygenase n=1 Tax=Micromonospora yangpuensis TaxID=683228 RepID=A0A1C6V6J7_9ACTN|nr:biliverdin-producing heme oxygenase [Micromonospora yangpuensis]GGM18723.1 biliverdin-producing heme oxygenase [Micromonospora yangpuensis]SCL61704.1 heme oxygenase [Micromonospora yangpuensis]